MQLRARKLWICRFFYLNIYALLLLLAGGGLLLLPTYRWHWAAAIPQVVIAIVCIKNAVRILSAWSSKMREYRLLMLRNMRQFNPSSFAKFMEAPCGRQLVKLVLRDLGRESEYKSLLKYKKSIFAFVRTEMCVREQKGASITFFNEDGQARKGDAE